MNHYVYALSSPDEPNIIRYIGRTGVHPRKRWADHISATRFKIKRGLGLSPVMAWIEDLLVEDKIPDYYVLGTFPDEEQAIATEMTLISAFAGTILNDPSIMKCLSGKKIGQIDTPTSRANKRRAAVGKDTELVRKWAQSTNFHKRTKEGYPRPDLSVKAEENLDHWYALKGKKKPKFRRPYGPRPALSNHMTEIYRQWRADIGCPNPLVSVWHEDNEEWTRKNWHNIPPFKNNKRR